MQHKLSLLTRIRMWVDYVKYLIFLQQGETIRVLMGLLIFILSVYLIEHELVNNFKNSHGEEALNLIIILIVIKFIWEAFVTREEIKSYFHIQRSILRNNLAKPFVSPSKKEQEAGFEIVEIPGSKADLIYSSKKINDHIFQNPLTVKMSQAKKKHISSYIQTHREILLQYLNHYFFSSLSHNLRFTNDKKLGLSRDINLFSNHVICHVGGYYDSFVTNQVSGTTLMIKDKVHTTITTEHIFPSFEDENGNRYLHDISSSNMNDHLGCSTIALTSDNYLLIKVQGSTNQFSRNMLVPTGSGSANFSDLTNHNLQKTVVKTMQRELLEEVLADKSVDNSLNKTMILGFYRWVTRGGKPEFTGITKLPGLASQYKPNPNEIRTDLPSQTKYKINSIEELPKVLEEIKSKSNLSTPLYMCLYHLEEMFKNHKKELAEFLKL